MIIVVDTLRADHLGAYGYDRPTSPSLDALQQRGWLRFTNAYAHSPWTLPSFASILTSLPPPVHRAGRRLTEGAPNDTGIFHLRPEIPTAPELVRGVHGFKTAAFVNNPYLASTFGLDRGFDHYDHESGSNQESRRAADMMDRAIAWVRGVPRDERFFALIHLMDPHLDYDPPPSFAEALEGGEARIERPDPELYSRIKLTGFVPDPEVRRTITRLYDGEIAYLDREIGRFVAALEDSGRLASTAIMITADHGEEFWDHGSFEHGQALYDELVRVPLWLKLPEGSPLLSGLPPDRNIDDLVCHVDLLPTLLDVLAISTDAALMGHSYFSRTRPSDACYLGYTLYGRRYRGLVSARGFKFIENKATGEVELYDLRADPKEQNDLSEQRPQQIGELRADLSELEEELRRLGNSIGVGVPRALDEATLERLRAMGYIR